MTPSQASNAIIAYEGRPMAVVEAILTQVVSSGTPTYYANHNADQILWIYEKNKWREALLRDLMVERLITDKAQGKKAMCSTCKDALNTVNINDDNCPILLAKMTFNIFSHYMPIKNSKNSGVDLSDTSYGVICSALIHIYRVVDPRL